MSSSDCDDGYDDNSKERKEHYCVIITVLSLLFVTTISLWVCLSYTTVGCHTVRATSTALPPNLEIYNCQKKPSCGYIINSCWLYQDGHLNVTDDIKFCCESINVACRIRYGPNTKYQQTFRCHDKEFEEPFTCPPQDPLNCTLPGRTAYQRVIHHDQVVRDIPRAHKAGLIVAYVFTGIIGIVIVCIGCVILDNY